MKSLEEGLPFKVKQCLAEGKTLRHVVFVNQYNANDIHFKDVEVELQMNKYKLPYSLGLEHQDCGISAQKPEANIDTYIEAMASSCIIPYIEDRIRDLEVIISSCRRGLKNQLKTLLFRKTPSESNLPIAGPTRDVETESLPGNEPLEFSSLKHNSVESAMRQQSDLLLMVGDYNTAISTLKLLSSDLKSDKLYFHFAAAQECLAIAYLLGNVSVSSAIVFFKEAFVRYAGIVDREKGFRRSLSSMCCTRVSLEWSGLLASMSRYSEASWIVMRAHFYEGNLRAAFLLEYSGYCLSQQSPPKLRKHGFHLVLSALRYSQSNQYHTASLLHKRAIQVLQGKGWDILEEHIHEALDQECNDSGERVRALEHAIAMLQCYNIPASIQANHMAHLLNLHQALHDEKSAFPIEIGLPVFDTSHISIISAGNHDYYDASSRQTSLKIWKDMEGLFSKKGSAHSKLGSIVGSQQNVVRSCAGEDILLNIPVFNPLKIELELSKIHLICGTGAEKHNIDSCHISIGFLHLYPGESCVLPLKCRPIDSGSLIIDGLSWKIGEMPCTKNFMPSVSKWAICNEIREPRGGSIEFQILPPMPRLHINHSTFPEELFVGEIFECNIELSNEGAIGLCNLECVASKDVFLEQGSMEEMNEGFDYNRFKFDKISLAVSDKHIIKAYFRPQRPGHHYFHIAWKYEPAVKSDSSPSSRILRFSKTIYARTAMDVLPALISNGDDTTLTLQVHGCEQMSSIQMEDFMQLEDDFRMLKLDIATCESTHINNDYEFVVQLQHGCSSSFDDDLSQEEKYFLKANIRGLKESLKQISRGPFGILPWKARADGRDVKGITVAQITSDIEIQSLVGQLCGPASLNHSFSKGPLIINLELRITSNVSETVDASWMLGRTPKVQSASSRVRWKGETCGMQHDIYPGEKRFVILEAIVDKPGVNQIDGIYITWIGRSASMSVGSLTIEPSSIRVNNVSDSKNNLPST